MKNNINALSGAIPAVPYVAPAVKRKVLSAREVVVRSGNLIFPFTFYLFHTRHSKIA